MRTIVDLRPYLVGQTFTFNATAHEVGSEDLTFMWSFGDGLQDVSKIYYSDGVSPDPQPSAEVNPTAVTDVNTHAFTVAGAYVFSLTVTDDDDEVAYASFQIIIGD